MDDVFASLCAGPLSREWQAIGLFATYKEHVGKILEVLSRALEWLPNKTAIDTVRLQLETGK